MLILRNKHLRNKSLKRDYTSLTESPSSRSPLKNKAVFSSNLVTINPTSWKADLKIFKGFREETRFVTLLAPLKLPKLRGTLTQNCICEKEIFHIENLDLFLTGI